MKLSDHDRRNLSNADESLGAGICSRKRMKLIPLTQGQVTKVCDCHAHLVEHHKWLAKWDRKTHSYYAARGTTIKERLLGAPKTESMHRVINNTPRGFETDHINHDTLDNQCSNLRTVTSTQNQLNKSKRKDNTSGHRGVVRHKHGKWQAQIQINKKNKYLGLFESVEDASAAYETAAKELHGEFYLGVTNETVKR